HRGLPGPRGRGVRLRRVAPRRARLLCRLGRRAAAVEGEVPRSLVRRARGDRDVHDGRAHRGHDRDRRLARHRDGRGRQVSGRTLYDEIQEARARYPPGSRSAILPALQLAQDRYGWLSPDVLREVADAMELTPAYCESVASFYDMFHLAPAGEHTVEVCTNVSCAVY